MALGRVQVVVVAVDARLAQGTGLLGVDLAQASAELELGMPLLDLGRRLGHPVQFARGGLPGAGDDAAGGGPELERSLGSLDELFFGDELVARDLGRRDA